MNLVLRFRDALLAISEAIVSELNQMRERINEWASKEHHTDGTHANVTADSMVISGTLDVTGATTITSLDATGDAEIVGPLTVGNSTTTALVNLNAPATGSPSQTWQQNGTQRMTLAYVDSVMDPCRWHDESGGGLRLDGSGNTVASGSVTAGATVGGTYLIITDGVTAPSATVGVAKLYVDTADGDLKIVFGDGTVKTIVTDT